jgi:hypothetical protein
MPCENCPEVGRRPAAAEVVYVVYTGGPQHLQYAALAHAIPGRNEQVVLQYGWPTVRPDGSIEYAGGQAPPVPKGFEATADPHVLKPAWPSCTRRMLKVEMHQDNGLLEIDGMCCWPPSGKSGRHTLTLADCRQCPVRSPIVTGRTGGRTFPPYPPAKSST